MLSWHFSLKISAQLILSCKICHFGSTWIFSQKNVPFQNLGPVLTTIMQLLFLQQILSNTDSEHAGLYPVLRGTKEHRIITPLAVTGMGWGCCRYNLSVALMMRPHLFLYLECEESEHHNAQAPLSACLQHHGREGCWCFLWGHLFQCFKRLPRDCFLTFEVGCEVTQTYIVFLLEG